VSDGEVNATIPKTVDPMQIQMDEAVELLKERAAKGGGRRSARAAARTRGGRKAAASKAPRRTGRKARKEPAPEGG
jgi:DNA topoisomerase-1